MQVLKIAKILIKKSLEIGNLFQYYAYSFCFINPLFSASFEELKQGGQIRYYHQFATLMVNLFWNSNFPSDKTERTLKVFAMHVIQLWKILCNLMRWELLVL
jgi:hypothetical protein